MLKLQEKLVLIQPADSLYVISKSLADHIDRYTFSFLMCPTLPSYVGKLVTNLVLDILEKNPASGWPVDIGHSKAKMDIIKTRVQTKLTERRNQMKAIILASLGVAAAGDTSTETTAMQPRAGSTTIVNLCENLVGIYKGVALKVTIQMCSRVAVLRDVAISSGNIKSGSFWPAVDKELQSVRDAYPLDPKKRSRIFAKNLTNDRRLFGQADLDALHDVNGSVAQQEAEQVVNGTAVLLFASPADMSAVASDDE
ncbi:hypothetical protein HWV62_10349 [Athelia sp. TMB]|nr:hypothetical protein HWV62_10349 [Athelia sp. TMB]